MIQKNKNIITFITYIIIALALIWAVFPLYWTLATSLKERVDIFAIPPKWFFEPIYDHYTYLFTAKNYLHHIFNSIVITSGTIALSMVLGLPAAYGIARFKFKGRNDIFSWILSTRMFPPIAIIIPIYLLMSNLRLLDTHLSLIIMYTSFNLPLVIWLMASFFKEVPVEIEEAALIDGCSRIKTFIKIVLPLSLAGLAATAILCFIFSWNEFFFALILVGENAKTATLATTGFLTEREILWGQLTAASIIIMFPTVIFAAIAQKYLVKGLTFGAVKG